MKPLLYSAAIVFCLGAIGLLARFAQLWRRDPSVRSMVSNEENQARFLLGGVALLVASASMVWLA